MRLNSILDMKNKLKEYDSRNFDVRLSELNDNDRVYIIPYKRKVTTIDIEDITCDTVAKFKEKFKKGIDGTYRFLESFTKKDLIIITEKTSVLGIDSDGIDIILSDFDKKVEIDIGDLETNKIAFYRKKLKFTQKDFGSKIGVNQQNISGFEKDTLQPKSDDITEILRVFGDITFDELFNTGRISFYLDKENEQLLDLYMQNFKDYFKNEDYTKFQQKSIILNQALKEFLKEKSEIK